MESRTLTSKEMNKSQRATLVRAINFAKGYAHNQCPQSVRVERSTFEESGEKVKQLYAVIKVRREDCSKYSPRRIMTDVRMHITIGPRGGMYIMDATSGINHSIKTHATKMLRCANHI